MLLEDGRTVEVALYVRETKEVLTIKLDGDCEECVLRPSDRCEAPHNILCAEMHGCWQFEVARVRALQW